MHYLLYLRLLGFYVGALKRKDPVRFAEPFAVHRRGAVLDVCPKAYASGVRCGMALGEAKAFARGVHFVEATHDAFLEDRTTWLDACTAFSNVVEPAMPDEAFVDLSEHPDPGTIAEKLLSSVESVSGMKPIHGVARTKWIARLAADHGDRDGQAYADPERFLEQFPVECLLPVPVQLRERLRFLGYRRIGDVAMLPVSLLRSQFGADARRISSASRGGEYEYVKALWPEDSLYLRARFDPPTECLETFENGLRKLAMDLGADLRARDSQGRRVELSFTPRDGDRTVAKRTFVRPLRDETTALVALRLLATNAPSSAIECISVCVRELEKSESRQRGLGRLGVAQESIDVPAIRSLLAAFGDDAVRVASMIELPRRKKVLKAWKEALGWN